jgi:signal transduction histidine kinase
MLKLTEATIGSIRRISLELRPAALDDLGLQAAIEWQCRQFQIQTDIHTDCDLSIEDDDMDRERSAAVFRIFQEGLTNIRRHSGATSVHISIKKAQGSLVLTIRDNGKGITEDEKSTSQSLGILGMHERALSIGGKIEITGTKGKGTVVTLWVPISGSSGLEHEEDPNS